MGKHEKAPQVIGVPQFAELAACVLKQLPRDIDPNVVQGWIMNPKALGKALQNALCPPPPPVLERVRASGYLDTSFDGREVHPFVIRPLTKEGAFAEYRAGDGEPWVWDELENNMPYVVPEVKCLNVMILDFGKGFSSNRVPIEMDNLDVRPLVYEELIQYGIVYPEHQKQKILLGVGTRYLLRFYLRVPLLHVIESRRSLSGEKWDDGITVCLSSECRFLVVPK